MPQNCTWNFDDDMKYYHISLFKRINDFFNRLSRYNRAVTTNSLLTTAMKLIMYTTTNIIYKVQILNEM